MQLNFRYPFVNLLQSKCSSWVLQLGNPNCTQTNVVGKKLCLVNKTRSRSSSYWFWGIFYKVLPFMGVAATIIMLPKLFVQIIFYTILGSSKCNAAIGHLFLETKLIVINTHWVGNMLVM